MTRPSSITVITSLQVRHIVPKIPHQSPLTGRPWRCALPFGSRIPTSEIIEIIGDVIVNTLQRIGDASSKKRASHCSCYWLWPEFVGLAAHVIAVHALIFFTQRNRSLSHFRPLAHIPEHLVLLCGKEETWISC